MNHVKRSSGLMPAITRRRVAIADDDDGHWDLWYAALETRGYRVVATSTVAETLDQIASAAQDADVFLLDARKPAAGVEFVRAVRRLEAPPPVVVVAGYDDWRRLALESGATAYLRKPISASVLDGTLRALVEHPRPARVG